MNRREGVLNNKWYIGLGTGDWAESVTTPNSYIINREGTKRETRRKKRKKKDRSCCLPSKSRVVSTTAGRVTQDRSLNNHYTPSSRPQSQILFGSTSVPCDENAGKGLKPKVVHHTDSKSVANISRKSSAVEPLSQADHKKKKKETYVITPRRLFRVHSTAWASRRGLG